MCPPDILGMNVEPGKWCQPGICCSGRRISVDQASLGGWTMPSMMNSRAINITLLFFGILMIVVLLQQVRTSEWNREKSKMSMNTPASWSKQAQRTQPRILPSVGAFHDLILKKADLTSMTVIVGTGTPDAVRAGDVNPLIFSSK